MRTSLALCATAFALLAPGLHAATLSCPSRGLTYTTVGYNLEVSSSSSSGSNATAVPPSLTAQVPLDANYIALFRETAVAYHIPTCTLVDVAGTVTMTDVVITDLKLLSGNYYTLYTPGPVVQLVMSFSKVDVTSSPTTR